MNIAALRIETSSPPRADASATSALASAEEIIAEARAGRMFLLVDDEDRENEGDLVIPAQFATPAAINFMARHGRGLICLALTRERVDWLGLRPMSGANASRHSTAFTVSIEARDGISTGISAQDRARTVAVAIAKESTSYDVVSPGHIFPLAARDGGTLVRAGHTEAAVDVSRLAGLDPSGVICEVMKDDGTMARLPDLLEFARLHGLKIGTIADLIEYRRRTEKLVRCISRGEVVDGSGRGWTLTIFRDPTTGAEHITVTKGDVTAPEPVLVHMHMDDAVGSLLNADNSQALSRSLDVIADTGRGAVVMLRGTSPVAVAEARFAQKEVSGLDDYSIFAQILTELGIRDIRLLASKPLSVGTFDGIGMRVVEHIAV